MYPLNSNGNYSDHHGHFATDSKQEDPDPSLSFSNFPSPYYNQCEFELDDVFLLHNQTFMPDSVSDTIISLHAGSTKNEDSKKATEVQQTPRKRTSFSKSDRHSKINTANGLRDRRMRLSLNVAREFFGLQDMLGFDKASRTVEWLLIQAREEIRKLERTRDSNTNNSSVAVAEKSLSSTSEGEVASGTNILGKLTMIEKKVRQNPLARDLREKARERAKARTKAKKLYGETKAHNTSLLQAKELSPRDIEHMIDEPMGARDIEHMIDEPMGARDIEHMIDQPMATINKWSSNPMFNCLQNSGINQEHLSFGKPWEAYN